MKLIADLAETAQVLTESVEGTKRMYIAGPFLMFDKPNRNGRIYPQKVMDAAVKKYKEDYIDKNRSLGEMLHPCFDSSANVFVDGKGLIPITEVEIGDYVYGVNSKNETVLSKVLTTSKTHFEGNLLHFNSRSFKATVTPYHRFYIKDRKDKFSVVTAEDIKNQVVTGSRSLAHNYIPITMENWVGGIDEETIILKKTLIRQNNSKNDYADVPLELNYKKFCAFLGIYLSEGSIDYHTRNDGSKTPCEIRIHQNIGTNLDLIVDLVSSLGVNKFVVRYTNNIKADVVITDIRLADYLAQFGNCYEKFVPIEVLQSTKENIEEFLTWFQLGDGSSNTRLLETKNQIGEYTHNDVFTVSEKMANGLIECILKTGHSTTKKIQISKKDYMFADHLIKVENKSPLYRMTIGNSRGKYVDNRFIDVEEIPHDDFVYCLTTETDNFYVEQHGTCFLSGNCRLTIDPERACIMTTELNKDGNYYYGKAKVLSTPLGKLLENLLADGVKIGVSSRGAGSLTQQGKHKVVGNDFSLVCGADVVTDPSVSEAFVDHLMEEKEWVLIEGHYVEKDLFEAKARIKKAHSMQLEEAMIKEFQLFLNKISSK